MNQNDRYFFYSGIISLTFFASIILGLLYSITFAPKAKDYAMHLSDVIAISIDLSDKPVRRDVPQEKPATKEPEKQEAEPEPPAPATTPATPVISDLFASVKNTESTKSEKKVDDSPNLDSITREILSNNKSSSLSKKASSIETAKPSIEVIEEGGSTGPEVNKYYAEIRAILEKYFRPPEGSEGIEGRIKIKLSANGRLLSYSVTKKSRMGSFNSELEWLRDRLESVKFPAHPENRDTVLEFIMKSKE